MIALVLMQGQKVSLQLDDLIKFKNGLLPRLYLFTILTIVAKFFIFNLTPQATCNCGCTLHNKHLEFCIRAETAKIINPISD
jgi:hypothetical protein